MSSYVDKVKMWNMRLGLYFIYIMNKVLNCLQIPNFISDRSFFYEACQFGKMHQTTFPASFSQTKSPLN